MAEGTSGELKRAPCDLERPLILSRHALGA